MLQKTNRTTLVEQVALQIQTLIESGQWAVGARIPAEPELVAELGVSRNTVREAVRALVHAGLLATKQGDGTYVCSASILGVVLQRRIKQSSLLETLELRDALEQEAARLAAIRRTQEDMDAMLLHLDTCDKAVLEGNIVSYAQADIQLHQTIVEATHNSLFIDLYEHMTDALRTSVESVAEMKTHSNFYQQIHRELVEAIIEQDSAKATGAVHKYIELSREGLHSS
ncbi:FadR/GntR family transcriptional regulator [Paenibacillus thalictri]|uniref:FadR family transcriptional regulator n=1 Tax=Paenibacillus thalictri TaxID=2527873 RepID=A0A4Q9DHE3_9BACL|nr:FadR/GntR family transcriptional regulator [Paenibacillus thalictri]TBL70447.1 FadR family transcriptional regulator [Paenibacillus thalictri]